MTLESESEEVCLVRTGPKTTQKEDGPRTRSQIWRALKVNGTNSERSKRPVSKYGCRALPLDRIHSDVTSEMCPRNLNLFGPFGVFMGLLMPLRVSMTVYLSHLEFFCPRLSLKGTLFIPIVSNQMIKIRREIIQRPKTAKCVKLIIFS